jgi:hypothetical protein
MTAARPRSTFQPCTDDFEARRNMDEALIAAGRPVFDGEWKKIKAEMKGEEFQTGE